MSIVGRGFSGQARAIGAAFGLTRIAIAEYQGQLVVDSDEEFEAKIRTQLVDEIISGLTSDVTTSTTKTPPRPKATPSRTEVVVRGSLTEITDEFESRLWTDGLPIVPPTLDRVAEFMRHTSRDADEVIGLLLPARQEATVWSVAVNGVMAGCRPEYLPLLLGVVDAIADPKWRVQDTGSTPGWEPLVVVNGPVVQELDFNDGAGVLRLGRRANSSVGRFLRLYLRNVAGVRIPPGTTDKGSIAGNFNVALAENEEACRELGWETYAQCRGWSPDDSVVTVQSVEAISPPIYSSGGHAESHLYALADVLGLTACHWTHNGLYSGTAGVLVVMSPYVAHAIARDGLAKADVTDYIYENSRMSRRRIMEFSRRSGTKTSFSLEELVERGAAPAMYGEAEDDDMLPIFPWRENIHVVVAGDPARNQSRGYLVNHDQGPPTSKPLEST